MKLSGIEYGLIAALTAVAGVTSLNAYNIGNDVIANAPVAAPEPTTFNLIANITVGQRTDLYALDTGIADIGTCYERMMNLRGYTSTEGPVVVMIRYSCEVSS